jgi:hypothetical protein
MIKARCKGKKVGTQCGSYAAVFGDDFILLLYQKTGSISILSWRRFIYLFDNMVIIYFSACS